VWNCRLKALPLDSRAPVLPFREPRPPQRSISIPFSRHKCLQFSVFHPFEFFSPCEDFVILVEQAFQRALVSFVCFLRASAPPRFNPPVVWLRLRRFAGQAVPPAILTPTS
jgi:hypothetical protein